MSPGDKFGFQTKVASSRPGGVPLGAGTPSKPERKTRIPSKKKSQWKALGFFKGNSDPWAMRDYPESA